MLSGQPPSKESQKSHYVCFSLYNVTCFLLDSFPPAVRTLSASFPFSLPVLELSNSSSLFIISVPSVVLRDPLGRVCARCRPSPKRVQKIKHLFHHHKTNIRTCVLLANGAHHLEGQGATMQIAVKTN